MTEWAAFAGLTGVVLFSLLALARASQAAVSDDRDRLDRYHDQVHADGRPRDEPFGDSVDAELGAESDEHADAAEAHAHAVETHTEGVEAHTKGVDEPSVGGESGFGHPPASRATRASVRREDDRRRRDRASAGETDPVTGVRLSRPRISTAALLVNVALSQGVFGVVLVAGAWYTDVPLAALGVAIGDALSTGLPAVAIGLVLGSALYAANAVGAASAASFGFEHDETLRDLLTPTGPVGWVVLLGFVLPVIAGFEEFLFRGILVGVLSTGFGVSPWLLAVASSVAFAFGHGAQGRAGVVVTGALGFVLASAFVLTNSLLVVVLAHYVVNAAEFVVSGWLGVEWGS